jgi:hypothetical protein
MVTTLILVCVMCRCNMYVIPRSITRKDLGYKCYEPRKDLGYKSMKGAKEDFRPMAISTSGPVSPAVTVELTTGQVT